jgi:ferredoxin
MPIIKFVKEKKEVEVPVGANLRAEAVKAGINLNTGVNGIGASINQFANCLGFGMCGTCRINIKKGMENLNPLTTRESIKFKYGVLPDPIPMMSYIGNEDKMRLACMCTVHGDIEVESTPEFNLFGTNFFS